MKTERESEIPKGMAETGENAAPSHESDVQQDGNACQAGIAVIDGVLCEALETSASESRRWFEYLCEKVAHLLTREAWLEIQTFGTFRVRSFRPVQPARIGDHSFVEAPYLGPVEFCPSALLIRQLGAGQIDKSLAARCDPLYSSLRDDGILPRGRIPVLIKASFWAIASALISERMVGLPSIGCLLVRQRPPRTRFEVATKTVQVIPGQPTVLLRISKDMIARIPRREVRGLEPSPPPVIKGEPEIPLDDSPLLDPESSP